MRVDARQDAGSSLRPDTVLRTAANTLHETNRCSTTYNFWGHYAKPLIESFELIYVNKGNNSHRHLETYEADVLYESLFNRNDKSLMESTAMGRSFVKREPRRIKEKKRKSVTEKESRILR